MSAGGTPAEPDPPSLGGTGGSAMGGAMPGVAGGGAGGTPEPSAGDLVAQFFNVATGEFDPRFVQLPNTISSVELLPSVTLALSSAPMGTQSVEFTHAGTTYLDTSPPFRLTEDAAGEAVAWPMQVGPQQVDVRTFASADGSGEPLSTGSIALEVTAAGTDSTPESGAHSQHKFWVTADGYSDQSGEFAFMLLLPEGYDASVKYPIFVFLHHGDAAYRGIDNNGLPLTTSPLFTGPRAIHSSQTRIDFPAVVLIPQMIAKETIDGIEHEWASFTSLSNETGDYEPGPEPSKSASYVFHVLDDLISGTFQIDGAAVGVDSGRIYLGGHSMGGFGTWDLLFRRQNFWAAGVPMAGYQDHESAPLLKDTAIWSFHHEIDSYNPFHSDTMLQLISDPPNNGTKMKLTKLTFDTGGAGDQAHFRTPEAAWNEEPGLFEWIFSQAIAR